ncbi:hypothetical protein V8B55DRAFT_1474933 [Mucor lusitanicus]
MRSMQTLYLRFLVLVIRNPSTEAFSSMADTENKWNAHTFTPASLRRNHITAYLESIGQNRQTCHEADKENSVLEC